MGRVSKNVRRRRRIQAKKALAEIKPTHGITMRVDAIKAVKWVEEEIEAFLESGDMEHLEKARDVLVANRGGAIGDADIHFEKAIEDLDVVVEGHG